jgi:hypothetical protein
VSRLGGACEAFNELALLLPAAIGGENGAFRTGPDLSKLAKEELTDCRFVCGLPFRLSRIWN